MFGLKLSKNGKHRASALKDSIEKSSEIMSEKIGEGMKIAEEKMEMIKKYIDQNQTDIYKVSKISGFAFISLIGVGLLAYGVYSIMKE